ncbi:MAG: hypothetical protein ACK53L_01420, partial [Pirellulaceae bacterium]
SEAEIRSVGYDFMPTDEARQRYPVEGQPDGWYENKAGESFYYIRDPGLGLWMHRSHPHAF